MNRTQARRLSLWANGRWLLLTDTTALEGVAMSVADDIRLQHARDDIARSLLKRSGIPVNATIDEAMRIVGLCP